MGVMGMISLYADDSSDEKQEEWIAVGSVFGWHSNMFEASRQWSLLLEERGLEYFKASECHRVSRQFRKLWADKSLNREDVFRKASAIRDEFIEIINRNETDAIAFALDLRDFGRVMAKNKTARQLLHNNPLIVIYCTSILKII